VVTFPSAGLGPVIVPVARVPWHSDHSGYDRLVGYLPHAVPLRPPAGTVGRTAVRLAHRALRRHSPLPFYPEEHFALDARSFCRAAHSRAPLHFLYAESQLWFSRLVRSTPRRPLLASYHQPPEQLERLLPASAWRSLLARVDRVLVMADNQRPFFTQYLPESRVHLAPHGVDADVFSPAATPAAGRRMLLTVGWWLRDWTLLRQVHDRVAKRYGDDVDIVVVTRERAVRAQSWHPRATVCSGLSEQELVALYRRASVLALPLTGATANNALLEAMACGLPVVATAAEGIRTYVRDAGPAVRLVHPGDADEMTAAVTAALDGAASAADARARAELRSWAETFAWPVTAEIVTRIHRTVLAEAAR
jgi:glycosyltransferase involved in cell wall biosynthesis